MKVIAVPASLDERGLDLFAQELAAGPAGRALFDARRLRWVDPMGMLSLLAAGSRAGAEGERPVLQLPESPEVASYLHRMRFFEHAEALFEFHGGGRRGREAGDSDVLLEITAVRSHADVHEVVDRVNERATTILTRQLHYPIVEAAHFSVILSEVCQNIVEHSQATGWVATQTYSKIPTLDRRVVKIAVVDLGVGFRGSLASAHAARSHESLTDARALEAAFLHGLTRFHDPGRGQGLQQIRKRVGRWDGKVSIRSGTARITQTPSWAEVPPMEESLAPFPGAQIGMVLPARLPAEAEAPAAAPARRVRR